MVRMLIEQGEDARDESNILASTAFDLRNKEMIECLHAHGVDFNVKYQHFEAGNTVLYEGGHPVLYEALERCDDEPTLEIEIIKTLVSAGADVNEASGGMSPLVFALIRLRSNPILDKVCRLLVEKGANIDAQDDKGQTALHQVLHLGDVGDEYVSAKCLIELGANVSIVDNDGRIPLHYAVEWGLEATVNLLISSQLNLADKKGKTPLQLARDNDNDNILTKFARICE